MCEFLLANKVSQAENVFYDEEKINWAHFEEDLEYFVPNFNNIAQQEASESQDALTDSMNINLDEPTSKQSDAIASFIDMINDFRRSKMLIFPLRNMAKSLLAIRPTSTEVERAFSTCSIVMAPRRSRMKVDLLDSILIINKFYSLVL